MIAYSIDKKVIVDRDGKTETLPDKSSLVRLMSGDPCGLPAPMHDPVRISRFCVVERSAVTETRGNWADGYWVKACGRWLAVSRRLSAKAMQAIGNPKAARPAWTKEQHETMLELVASGLSKKEIAEKLKSIRPGVTPNAVTKKIGHKKRSDH